MLLLLCWSYGNLIVVICNLNRICIFIFTIIILLLLHWWKQIEIPWNVACTSHLVNLCFTPYAMFHNEKQYIDKVKNIFLATVSHTFLTNNHVRLHSSQNASDTGKVYDNHLRSTAKIT